MLVLKKCFSNTYFKIFFIILFLSVPGICLSSSCKDSFVSGAEVIKYVRLHEKQYNLKGYDKKWEEKVNSAFKYWGSEETKKLLKYLDKQIEKKDTLKRLKYPSYFKFSRYEKFKKLILFYESYLGVEGVTQRLRRSMGGFFIRSSLKKLKKVVKFIEGYIERDGVKERMNKDLQGFSNANFGRIKKSGYIY